MGVSPVKYNTNQYNVSPLRGLACVKCIIYLNGAYLIKDIKGLLSMNPFTNMD